jgi:hypothetical protein
MLVIVILVFMIMLKNMFQIPSVLAKPLSRTLKKQKLHQLKFQASLLISVSFQYFYVFMSLFRKKKRRRKKIFIILDVFIFRFYNLFMGRHSKTLLKT